MDRGIYWNVGDNSDSALNENEATYVRNDELISRKIIAGLIDCSVATMAVWDCNGRYDLQPVKIGREVFYRTTVILVRFYNNGNELEQLYNRKNAAKYTDRSAKTFACYDCRKQHDLNPIKIGRMVRYKKSELDKFNQQRMKP